MKCVDGRTAPKLWAKSKKRAIKKLGGRFSARAMQLAGKMYRKAGGRYCGRRTKAQRGMEAWTSERWMTAPGAPKRACHRQRGRTVCDRYLPEDAWRALSKKDRDKTRSKKRVSKKQWVSNSPRAKAAASKVRRRKA